jgi:hypothetical protein
MPRVSCVTVVPARALLWQSWMVAGVALIALSSKTPQAAAANPFCTWYVAQSVRQQQDNMQRACGFKGAEWSFDTRSLAVVCEGQPPQETRAMVEKRQQMLAECAKTSAPAAGKSGKP